MSNAAVLASSSFLWAPGPDVDGAGQAPALGRPAGGLPPEAEASAHHDSELRVLTAAAGLQPRNGLAREGVLAAVLPASRLGERPTPPTVRTGIAALDELTGGLPRGALSEFCGPASSGRTSVLLAAMAEATRRQEVCALVDAGDSFDPASAAEAGVDLRRLLWVRCGKQWPVASGQWPAAGGKNSTPGQKNHKLQIANYQSRGGLAALEHALKATDLLLQGGGFGMVIVDLGDVPPQAARRIPLTSWFRFRRAVENTLTALLVLEEEPYAKSCASLVVKLSAVSSQLAESRVAAAPGAPSHARLFAGLRIQAEVLRARAAERKPVRAAVSVFESSTAWRIA